MRCKFVDVRPCGDPADMFFADIEAIEYESDNQKFSRHAIAISALIM
jgi:hypothetical protein